MARSLTVVWVFCFWGIVTCQAAEPSPPDRKGETSEPAVVAALREACEIARKQDKEQHYWTERVLLDIGEVQIRAGDFEGALRSIRGSDYASGRDAGLVNLAEALAREGKRERAFAILRLLDSNQGRQQDNSHDSVQLAWIEHLITAGDFDRTRKAIEELKSAQNRPEALRRLAVAYAKSGDAARAAEQFTRAINAAVNYEDAYERSQSLWETAEAQLAVGNVDAAKATIRTFVEPVKIKDANSRYYTLLKCAEIMAKAKDRLAANGLFRRAIEAVDAVDQNCKSNAFHLIAKAQAEVGFIEEALTTAALIKRGKEDARPPAEREEALCAIASAQVKANDPEGAVRTASLVKRYMQYHDDALLKVVEYHIAKKNLKRALAVAETIQNPSSRATGILQVATAYAKAGDRKTAADVAGRIVLTESYSLEGIPEVARSNRFDYRLPRSWAERYDAWFAGTLASGQIWNERAAEVAAAAMAFSLALGLRHEQSFAISFNEITTKEVTRALARTHAAMGNASEALAWARKVGSNGKVKAEDDYKTLWAVERRIHALVGVAEGMLDKSSKVPPKPGH